MELNDLEYDRNSMISQKEDAESEKVIAQEKVDRLKFAYKQTHNAIKRIRELQSDIKSKESTNADWKGSTFQKHTNYVSETFNSNYTSYINHLDGLQDDINSEIARQENNVLRLSGDIFGLAQAIDNLWRQIQNWFN